MSSLIKLDGSYGEGGGALLRAALSVSVLTQQSFQIENIRTGTKYVGLDVEDVVLIKTLAELTNADVSEYGLGTLSLLFSPKQSLKPLRAVIPAIRDERKRGPNALVLATTLAPLLARSGGYSDFEIEGETFSNSSMTYDFLAEVVMPVWRKMNLYVSPEIHRAAYDRVTEGRCRFEVEPASLTALHALDRGAPKLFTAKITSTKGQRAYIDRITSHLNKLARSMRVPFNVDVTDVRGDQSAQFLTLCIQFESGMGGAGCMGSWRVEPEQIAQTAFDKL
ncbi:MAG TPA: RNA 3'-terminal phosphate cyclase, partial [Fimbriimonas sp.]|nr:RNA 3'-terminal phosphate cyclase [Fimbriimonas sp.]